MGYIGIQGFRGFEGLEGRISGFGQRLGYRIFKFAVFAFRGLGLGSVLLAEPGGMKGSLDDL